MSKRPVPSLIDPAQGSKQPIVDSCREGLGQGQDPGAYGRWRLIRSKGWMVPKYVSARRSGQQEEFDERILGSGDFVNAILKEADEKTKTPAKAPEEAARR